MFFFPGFAYLIDFSSIYFRSLNANNACDLIPMEERGTDGNLTEFFRHVPSLASPTQALTDSVKQGNYGCGFVLITPCLKPHDWGAFFEGLRQLLSHLHQRTGLARAPITMQTEHLRAFTTHDAPHYVSDEFLTTKSISLGGIVGVQVVVG